MFNFRLSNFFKLKLSPVAVFLVMLMSVFGVLSISQAQAFSFGRNLGIGSVGQDVQELQKFLNANGYVLANSGAGAPGRETTYFGFITRAALIKFQKANGISPAVGFFGPITRTAVNKKVSDSVLNSQPAAESSGGLQPVDQSNEQPLVVDKSVRYAISGMITGISGTIVVQNNGKDDWTINPTDNSIFTFPTAMLNGQTYLVTVKTKPINHVCYVSNGTGVVNHANIDNIKIACGVNLSSNPFTHTSVGGGSPVTYTLTYTAGAGGFLTGSASQTVNSGASGSAITAVADANYSFVNWSDSSTDNPRTDTNVTANKSVTANFTIDTFTITSSAGAGGTIDPLGVTTKDYGSSQVYTITADGGYSISDIFVDSQSVGPAGSYEFTDIQANHTIEVQFSGGEV